MDAFRLHADGYLTKPIYAEDVQEQIDHIKRHHKPVEQNKLVVRCFGNFEVYKDDKPLVFGRKKAKEFFAYLIDRQGALVSVEQMAAVLWEDDAQKHKIHIYQLAHHLKEVLEKENMADVFIISGGYAVNEKSLDCDYYKYLKNDPSVKDSFLGEYMSQYSWAEATCGYLMKD